MSIDRRWLLAAAAFFAAGAAPWGRYTLTADTAADAKTGLTWQRTIPAQTYTQPDAVAYCQSLSLGGLASGWRLPARKELDSLVDPVGFGPAIDGSAFAGTPNQYFWTSSTTTGGNGWYVDFTDGANNTAAPSQAFRVRCVR